MRRSAILTQEDFHVATLGLNQMPSPLRLSSAHCDGLGDFVAGTPRIRYQLDVSPEAPHQDLLLEQAGPRERIYFDPFYTTAAIVTCGGLCPGLNNVFVHVPICTAIREKKRMELTGELWTNVLLSTGQPRWPSVPGLVKGDEDQEADADDVAEHEIAAMN